MTIHPADPKVMQRVLVLLGAAVPVWVLLAWAGLSGWLPAVAGLPEGATEWLLLCLVYPVLEELVFRGALQGALLRRGGFWQHQLIIGTPAGLLAALVFALAHLLRLEPWWALATLVPGLALGWLRDFSGRVGPGMLVHAVWNLGALLALYWGLAGGLG